MESGQSEELPDEAKREDLTMVAGRLRAAMIRAGKRAHYTVLKQLLDEIEAEPVNKQTVHNWFKPTCRFIDQAWLFKVAKLLDCSPEWLATGEGPVAAPMPLSDATGQVIGVWKSLPDEDARTKWVSDGESLARLLNKKPSTAAPYKPVPVKRR